MHEAGFEPDVAVHKSFDETGSASAAGELLSRPQRPAANRKDIGMPRKAYLAEGSRSRTDLSVSDTLNWV